MAALFAVQFLALAGWAPRAAGQIAPPAPPPSFEVIGGDGFVRIEWPRQPDSLLADSGLGDPSLPDWNGKSAPFVGGLFTGICDQDYRLEVLRSPLRNDTLIVFFQETPIDTPIASGRDTLFEAGTPDTLIDGFEFMLESSLTVSQNAGTPVELAFLRGGTLPDTLRAAGSWGGSAAPYSNGLFLRGMDAIVTFTAAGAGAMDPDPGISDTVTLDWRFAEVRLDTLTAETAVADTILRTGSLAVTRSDSLFGATFDSSSTAVRFLKVGLHAGVVTAADSFVVRARPSVFGGDQLIVSGRAAEGYAIWRSEVIDLKQPILVGRMRRCEAPAPESLDVFLQPEIVYVDEEVHNGFPYYYAVTVADGVVDSIPSDVWLDIRQKVYPRHVEYDPTFTTATSLFRDASQAHVVPNPYKVSSTWEEGEPRIQFVNLPPQSTVRVFTGAGEWVITLDESEGPGDDDPASDRIFWDLKNPSGEHVVSGIYIFKVESPYGEKIGRFVVIR